MKDLKIDRAEVFVVGPDVDRYIWAEGMSEQYMANIILRLTSAGGLEGIAGAAMMTSHSFDRSVVGVQGMMWDVSAHAKAEATLRYAKKQAEEANMIKSQFLANVSHELRTPMHGILSFSKFGIDWIDTADKETVFALQV